jgi:Ca2+-transporting ATPase
LRQGTPEAGARAAAFIALVAANFGLVVVNRSHSASIATTLGRRNRAFWQMLAMTAALLAAAMAIPPVRALFHFAWPGTGSLAVVLATAIAVLALLEAMKAFGPRIWHGRIGVTP